MNRARENSFHYPHITRPNHRNDNAPPILPSTRFDASLFDAVPSSGSALESLIVLEPDVMKIDRNFVRGIAEEPVRRQRLQRLMTIAASLSSEIIAEGVETRSDASVLEGMGIQMAQGWLWDKPKSIESFQ